ncbi:hypothetical protein [Pseudonocardia sp. NPDC046786]|uniref:hypothetical protein n=1 Tax=Pseudonocardia sp. NPDC046786 TaxID=3155471 RepID=UPI0033F76126
MRERQRELAGLDELHAGLSCAGLPQRVRPVTVECHGLGTVVGHRGDREARLAIDEQRNPAARHKESQFTAARADVYNVCEWGGIDRLERDTRGGRIGHLRAAVVSQALVSTDDHLNEPHDRAGVPVTINEFTGSHYTALHLLEGTVPR